jgi:hypothetical protein
MNNLKTILLFFATIIVLSLFDLILVDQTMVKRVAILVYIIIILAYLYLLKSPIRPAIRDSFEIPLYLLFISFLISMVPAYLYHDQSIFSSIRSSLFFYVFLLYFVLFKLDFTYSDILRLSLFLFFTTLVIYAINLYTFPNSLFINDFIFSRRGGLTVRFSGQGFTFLGTFYFLSKFCRSGKFYYFVIYAVGFIFLTFLSESRIQLVTCLFNTLFVLYFYRKEISRSFLTVIPLFIIAVAVGIYYLQSYITNLYFLLHQEASTFSSNIRYEAFKYFIGDFQPNALTRILGNSYPFYPGSYSAFFEKAHLYRYWTEDLGLIGFWVYFGILGVAAWLIIFKKAFFWKTNDNNIYLKTYFIYLFSTITLGWAIFSPGYMITTAFCLFLFDKDKQEAKMNSIT